MLDQALDGHLGAGGAPVSFRAELVRGDLRIGEEEVGEGRHAIEPLGARHRGRADHSGAVPISPSLGAAARSRT